MKRKKSNYGNPSSINNGILHRNAFNHALGVFKPAAHKIGYNRADFRKPVIQFNTPLEFEDGKLTTALFQITQGLRVQIGLRNGLREPPYSIPLEYSHRLCLPRLSQYRQSLIAWQTTAENPLTFRDFNRLLAALSYEPQL